ncbi:DUF3168 domain-containing protein [Virgibacillus sp. C22-A2]|uniref:DUF3168 domain-containing protein n=1 Tax=Virgibacillus tibetensis TaxID=3042313 RepID=A0ABU6KAP9_9BACI|nr:DUF3168 domain-containing protein [Virgibacillus sp. C22-A2]
MSAIADTQILLYAALSPNMNVYVDEASEGAVSPYVVIGNTTMTNDSTKNRSGEDFTVTIHVWHETSGYGAKQLLAEVKQALSSLTMDGFNLWLSNVEYMDVLTDPSGWKHGILRIRMRIQEGVN